MRYALSVLLLLTSCYVVPPAGPPEGWVMPPNHDAATAAALREPYDTAPITLTIDAPGVRVIWHTPTGARYTKTITTTAYSTVWISVDRVCVFDGVDTVNGYDATITSNEDRVIRILPAGNG